MPLALDRPQVSGISLRLPVVMDFQGALSKGMTGHLISGSSAVEAAACLIALERGAIPPTVNLDDPDPECDLCHVANVAQERRVAVAVSNSFGFGGSNSCVVLRKVA